LKNLFLLLLPFLPDIIEAQSVVKTSAVLATAQNAPILTGQDRKITFLKAAKYQLPIVENIGFRTETDRFWLERQEYLARANFNGFGEMRQQKAVKQAKLQVEESSKQVLLHDALLERYAYLIAYRQAAKDWAMRRSLLVVYEDKVALLQKMAKLSTTDFDLNDLVGAEDDLHEVQQRIAQDEGILTEIQAIFQSYVKTEVPFALDTTDWIPLSMVRQIALESSSAATKHVLIAQREANILQRQTEYNLEKAEGQRILDFVQVRYSGRGVGEPLRNELSLGLGVMIPYKGSTKIALTEIEFKRLEEETKRENLQAQLTERTNLIRQQINSLFTQYDLVNRQLAENQARYALDRLSAMQGVQPLALLRMKEVLLKRELQVLGIEQEIMQLYLRYLDTSGQLSTLPLRNYLSAALASF
jgi:hypothetical protein